MVDVAETLVDGRTIPIVYTGLRPGEKVHEIMVSEEERYRTIERGDYYVICPMLPELRRTELTQPPLSGEYSSANITLDLEGLRQLLAPFLAQTPAVGAGA
jgi:UDP-glucose 4-epimerase